MRPVLKNDRLGESLPTVRGARLQSCGLRGYGPTNSVLCEMAVSDGIRSRIAELGGLPPLVSLTRTGTDEQKESAAGALRNLARNDAIRAAIADLGGLPPLIALCDAGTERQRALAAGALCELARNDGVGAKIAELGGLLPLISLCDTGTICGRSPHYLWPVAALFVAGRRTICGRSPHYF